MDAGARTGDPHEDRNLTRGRLVVLPTKILTYVDDCKRRDSVGDLHSTDGWLGEHLAARLYQSLVCHVEKQAFFSMYQPMA